MSSLAAIAFDPAIRGVLVVMVGVVVLFGSIYLIVATNTGVRTGFLIAMAGLLGWCFSMGIFWWIYGIGMIGEAPTWMEREINFDRTTAPVTPQLVDLPNPDPDAGELPSPLELLEGFEAENPGVREDIEATEGEGFVPRSLTQVVTLVPELKRELAALGRDDIMIVVGGVIPPQDYDELLAAGAVAVFPPGTVIHEAADDLLDQLAERLGYDLG